MIQAFPKTDESKISEDIEKSMQWLQEAITAFRNIRAEANINP
jgi:valyl-tRNA synthetase